MQQITFKEILLKTFLLVTLLPILTATGQKAYIGGNQTLPVIDAETYELGTEIYGFSSQLRWMQSSSDHSFIYSGTIFYEPELNLYKINASTDEIIVSKPVPFAVQDLEISEDDQFLFHHNSTTVYRVDAETLNLIDTLSTGKILSYITYFDNNTIFASSTERIYKLDFNTHSIVDSVTFGTFESPAEMVLNADKTKLFAYKNSTPLTLWVIDLASMSVENTVSLSGMLGSPGDLILSPDGSTLYITSAGSTTLDGSIRMINVSNMSTISDIAKDYGSGAMSFAPEGDLWIPNNTSNTITIIDTENNSVKDVINTDDYLNGPFSVAFGYETTGVTENTDGDHLTICPNPATNYFFVETTNGSTEKSLLSIYNLDGQLIKRLEVKTGDKVRIEDMQPGVYSITLQSEGRMVFSKLLVR